MTCRSLLPLPALIFFSLLAASPAVLAVNDLEIKSAG